MAETRLPIHATLPLWAPSALQYGAPRENEQLGRMALLSTATTPQYFSWRYRNYATRLAKQH